MLSALGFALCLLLPVCDAHAVTSADPGRARLSSGSKARQDAIRRFEKTHKPIDQPNPKDLKKARARQEMLEKQIRQLRSRGTVDADVEEALRQKGPVTDRVLVILVEFAGTDTMIWDPGRLGLGSVRKTRSRRRHGRRLRMARLLRKYSDGKDRIHLFGALAQPDAEAFE